MKRRGGPPRQCVRICGEEGRGVWRGSFVKEETGLKVFYNFKNHFKYKLFTFLKETTFVLRYYGAWVSGGFGRSTLKGLIGLQEPVEGETLGGGGRHMGFHFKNYNNKIKVKKYFHLREK